MAWTGRNKGRERVMVVLRGGCAVKESELAIVLICPSMSNLALQTAVTLSP